MTTTQEYEEFLNLTADACDQLLAAKELAKRAGMGEAIVIAMSQIMETIHQWQNTVPGFGD